jgi:sodium-coupled neutral amino acid transporter 11
MPGDELSEDHLYAQNGQDEHEAQSLLSASSEEHDLAFHPEPLPSPIPSRNATNGERHSSISQPAADGKRNSIERALSPDDTLWLEDEDYEHGNQGPRTHHSGQSIPLLTNIEAPSVTLATSDDFFPEEHLEDARPRSGMRMAFMNMANSIIGAGIIGQPYALRQAGMATGILLLTALTVTVDWTIRLIVINSKLSGADSFQATMQHCFGKSGLIAISVAQWAFAFGGMVAFCIIVGDTIPHVLGALFPSLRDMSFLWLLTDRRAVIVIFVLVVSYPLALYRDIAKVSSCSFFPSTYQRLTVR